MRGFRVNKEEYIVQRINCARLILHVGCTNSPNTKGRWDRKTLLHKRLCDEARRTKSQVIGIDIDRDAVQWLRERMPDDEIICADAHNLSSCFLYTRFDLIVAGDVIEHLANPGLFLESCRTALSPTGRVLLTTCNAYSVVRFLKSLLNHEAVHPEHIAYFSHSTLKRLCEMCGLEIVSLGYYKCEPVLDGSINRVVGNVLEHSACLVWPQLSEGVIVEARGTSSFRQCWRGSHTNSGAPDDKSFHRVNDFETGGHKI
jgi:SAM-dependent methyltransferase